jgi:signal transduction histidine kinase
MLSWFRRLPMTVRLPLAVAAMIFAAAIGTTQLAIQSVSRQFEEQLERLGNVYLDGLSAALLPPLRDGDEGSVERALEAALSVHEGMVDRRLLLLAPDRALVARADRAGLRVVALPAGVGVGRRGMHVDYDDASVWIWRGLDDPLAGAARGTLVANLDIQEFLEERQALRRSLALLDVLVSGACALLGFVVARRLHRPVALLAQHVEASAGREPRPIAEGQIPRDDPEIARLVDAFNAMADGAREREAMLAQLADQEREAVLGRMAATLAHEVRNPLAGILTAIRTLRRFGDRPAARTEALDFVERGVLDLQGVVDATLQTHRAVEPRRPLSARDLRDVCLLVEAEAKSRGVSIDLDVDLPDELAVAATEVRQILLNLLLNATHASAPGGRVTLRGRQTDGALRLEVIDRGRGLSPKLAGDLAAGTLSSEQPGLGVAVIVRLVERLDGRVSVEAHPESGTHVTLRLPLEMEPDAT